MQGIVQIGRLFSCFLIFMQFMNHAVGWMEYNGGASAMKLYRWGPICTKASTAEDRASWAYVTCPSFFAFYVLLSGAYIANIKRLLTKCFWQKSYLWFAFVSALATYSQAFCSNLLVQSILALVVQAPNLQTNWVLKHIRIDLLG